MLRKICNIISALLAVVLLALASVLIVPYFMGYTELAVLTGSMQPTLPVGTLIYVKETDPAQLEVGDVVTYRLDGDTMVTQGDANADPDGEITFDRIVGKMDFSIPYLGYISLNIRTPIGIVSICGVLVLIILLTFIPEIFSKDDEEEKKENEEKAEEQDKPADEKPE